MAYKYYERAHECDPLDTETKIGLANCNYMLENYDEVMIFFYI
jgi:hypothetical protein